MARTTPPGTICRAICALLSLFWICGCGESGPPAPTAAMSPSANSSTAVANPPGPLETVGRYLEAVRVGDASTVNNLLTSIARRKTAELNISVAPPGSDTARFEVGQLQYASDAQDAARVGSKWIELDENGSVQTHEITWILRHEEAGWRVAGMMGKFLEGQPVMMFNFEDPQEVIRQRDASERIMRQQAEEGRQRPADRQAQAVPAENPARQ